MAASPSWTLKIDGLDYNLNSTSKVAYYYQGSNLVLASIGYSGQIGPSKLFTISLGGVGGYSFNDNGSVTVGSISASATPIPTALPLLATGLGALALLGSGSYCSLVVASNSYRFC